MNCFDSDNIILSSNISSTDVHQLKWNLVDTLTNAWLQKVSGFYFSFAYLC